MGVSMKATHGVSLHVVECGEGPAVLFCYGFIALPEVGHWPQLEAAQQTNAALLGFLDENN